MVGVFGSNNDSKDVADYDEKPMNRYTRVTETGFILPNKNRPSSSSSFKSKLGDKFIQKALAKEEGLF